MTVATPDHLAEKLRLADAGAGDLPAPGAEPAGPVALADDSVRWIGAAVHYGNVLRAMLPAHVQPHWTEERLRAVGVELARCAQHYDWKFGEVLNHPGGMLAAAAFPLVWPFLDPYVKAAMARDAGAGSALIPAAAAVDPGAPVVPITPVKPIDG